MDGEYLVVDKPFKFEYDHNSKINWRSISTLNIEQLQTFGNLFDEQGGLSDILMNAKDISTFNLNKDRNCRYISQEGKQAMKLMQFGMQYFCFA